MVESIFVMSKGWLEKEPLSGCRGIFLVCIWDECSNR